MARHVEKRVLQALFYRWARGGVPLEHLFEQMHQDVVVALQQLVDRAHRLRSLSFSAARVWWEFPDSVCKIE